MKPVTRLPATYVLRGRLDLSTNKRLLLGMSLGGVALFLALGPLFLGAATALVPHLPLSGELGLDLPGLLVLVISVVAISAVVAVVHELMHAICYWLVTREWPLFGFKGVYAYVAAPGWYIPRLRFLLVGLAPLLLLTLIGLALLPALPLGLIPAMVFALTINAAGAVGDLYLVFRLLFAPATSLVRDEGNSVTWYAPGEVGRTPDT